MKEKHYTKLSANPIAVVLLAIIVLGTPILIRGIDNLEGVDPYFNQRLAELLEDDKFPNTDPLSFTSRPFAYSIGTPLALHYIEKLVPKNIALNFLPFILGILTVILMLSILMRYGFDKKVVLIANTAFVFSPPFIYNFVIFNSSTIPVFLNVFAVYLFLVNKKITNLIGGLIFLIIPFFGYFHVIFSLIFLYSIKRENVKLLMILVLLLTGFAYFDQLSDGFSITSVEERGILLRTISEFGGNLGISLFSIFIIFFGLRHLWNSKYKHKEIYLFLTILLLLFLVDQRVSIYLIMMISPIIALGILEINNSKWESGIIKYLTIILLLSGLIFSGLSFLSKIPQLPPSKEMITSLEFIRDRTNHGDVIFSHQTNGILINSIGQRPNVLDMNFAHAPKVKERLKDSKTLFYSRDFDIVKRVLEKYNIKYIYITPEMKHGLTWTEPEEGLLFVLEFSGNNFKRVYNNDGIEVWRVNFLEE